MIDSSLQSIPFTINNKDTNNLQLSDTISKRNLTTESFSSREVSEELDIMNSQDIDFRKQTLFGEVSLDPLKNVLQKPCGKRLRSQKHPVPEEEKDEKYLMRRQKNNLSAKKSRDLRKLREEKMAKRAQEQEIINEELNKRLNTLLNKKLTLEKEVQALCNPLSSLTSAVPFPTMPTLHQQTKLEIDRNIIRLGQALSWNSLSHQRSPF